MWIWRGEDLAAWKGSQEATVLPENTLWELLSQNTIQWDLHNGVIGGLSVFLFACICLCTFPAMRVYNLCNLEIKKEHRSRGRGWEPWKPRHSLHLVAEGGTPFLTQESDLMGIVFRKERNWCGRECGGEKPYWGDSHAGVDCINGEKETTVEFWKAVTKIWLGEGREKQGQWGLEGVSRLKHWEGDLSLLSFLT